MERASSSDLVPSSQQSLPSSHDPGWNDPPEWAMSAQLNSAGTSTKRTLNKRVAFPLSAQSSSPGATTSPASSPKPPPVLRSSAAPTITSAPHKPLVAPVDKTRPTLEEPDFDQDQALIEALTNLGTVITQREMEKSKAEEILRRLDILKTDWHENKLNETIQRSILDISKALLKKDVGEADRIHILLMMQHTAACRTWLPAIRHIIFELKDCESLSKLEDS